MSTINPLATLFRPTASYPHIPEIKPEKLGFFEIVWEFDELVDRLLQRFDYVDIDNNELAQRAIELAPRYKSAMNDDKIFEHLMQYKSHDDDPDWLEAGA